METHLSDLTQIAQLALLAVALGLVLVRLRQPPMVGYILAGIVLGWVDFGLGPHKQSITLLAELGVLLLLFLIGMELSLRAFMMVLRPALLTAGLQMAASLAVTLTFGYLAGWSVPASILMGFAIAVSSTALVINMLEDIHELRSDLGRITIGVLIAQDIAIVPILLLSESLRTGTTVDLWLIVKIALAIGGLMALVWALGRPGKIVIPFSDRISGRPDLLTLAMLAICMSGAALSGVFGLSPVYGAFVAGLVVGQSNLRSEAIPATRPVQSLLIVVFFLSIGLLIDLKFIAENWALLLAFVLGVIVLKSVLNVAILRLVGERWETAFPAGIIMSQVGEFSFVVAAVGLRTGVIDYSAYQAAITVIAVSLLISPFWLITVRRFHDVAEKGIANFRQALAEVYEDELAEIERGAAGVRRFGRTSRRWARAARRSIVRRGEAITGMTLDGGEEPEAHETPATAVPAEAALAAAALPAGERASEPDKAPQTAAAEPEPQAGDGKNAATQSQLDEGESGDRPAEKTPEGPAEAAAPSGPDSGEPAVEPPEQKPAEAAARESGNGPVLRRTGDPS